MYLRQDVVHFFALNKAIRGIFFGSLVTIITVTIPCPSTLNKKSYKSTNLPPAPYEASRSRCLFVSNLLHSFYCFEYNFTVTVTLYFHKYFMVDFDDKLEDRKCLSAYNRVLCIYNSC